MISLYTILFYFPIVAIREAGHDFFLKKNYKIYCNV